MQNYYGLGFFFFTMRAELLAVNQISDAGSELKYTIVFLEKNPHVRWLQHRVLAVMTRVGNGRGC